MDMMRKTVKVETLMDAARNEARRYKIAVANGNVDKAIKLCGRVSGMLSAIALAIPSTDSETWFTSWNEIYSYVWELPA